MVSNFRMALAIIGVFSCVSASMAGEPGVDRWGVNETSDAMTDKRIVSAGVGTSDGLIIQFQCSGDRFGAVIVPFQPLVAMEFITMDELVPVAWRIDATPAVNETWHVLQGRAGSSYSVVSLNAEVFASAIVGGGQRLTVRVHGLTSSVTLENAAQYVSDAAQACDVALQ